jgi:hypothetical protein
LRAWECNEFKELVFLIDLKKTILNQSEKPISIKPNANQPYPKKPTPPTFLVHTGSSPWLPFSVYVGDEVKQRA